MNIYVGNLSWQMTDEDLRNLFEQHGSVASAKIVKDKVSGRSKGFGLLISSHGTVSSTIYPSRVVFAAI